MSHGGPNLQPMSIQIPGSTFNIGSHDHLTQVQHKYDRVEIVDHFDKGSSPVDLHIVTRINRRGAVDIDIL